MINNITELTGKSVVFRLLIIMLIVINIRDVSFAQNDYCKLDCRRSSDGNVTVKHTMCEYQKDGPETCNRTDFKLTRADKKWLLEQLNNIRLKVAKGQEARGDGGKQPAAGNMMKLVWNGELAMFGRRWADQCDRGLHDVCRTAMDALDVGQNSYIGQFDEAHIQDRYGRMTHAIIAWFNEVVHMKPAWVTYYPAEAEAILGNYSQLVWGATVYVGCGYSEFGVGNSNYHFRFVCNFKQGGNVVGRRVYRPGRPCESCPPNILCSVTWAGLCFSGETNYFIDQEVSDESPAEFGSKFLFLGLFLPLYIV